MNFDFVLIKEGGINAYHYLEALSGLIKGSGRAADWLVFPR